ncbi:MAG: terminase small subunit [Cellvibrionaceae bacterium]|nr:terminase small subunit [Cellvibrionaceae bacterium]
MSLTEQQRCYAEARMQGHSKKDAAVIAGCPEKSAAQAGSRLERHPNVLAYIARLKAIESETTPAAGMDALPSESEMKVFEDPMEMLLDAMNDRRLDIKTRLDVAKALLPYEHQKLGDGGKKEGQRNKAEKVVQGKFKPSPPPQLKLV